MNVRQAGDLQAWPDPAGSRLCWRCGNATLRVVSGCAECLRCARAEYPADADNFPPHMRRHNA